MEYVVGSLSAKELADELAAVFEETDGWDLIQKRLGRRMNTAYGMSGGLH